MSRATGPRAYSNRNGRLPSGNDSGAHRKPHRVVPPTMDQYVDYLVHCAMRSAPALANGKKTPPGPYTEALGNVANE